MSMGLNLLGLVLCLGLLSSLGSAYIPEFLNGRPPNGFVRPPRLPIHPEELSNVETKWFKQRLNHFDEEDGRTWMQKYLVNDAFYVEEGGPLFVFIGGEGTLHPGWAVRGNWIDLANISNAMCLLVEHRYYGDSHPVPNLEVQNMKYLSSEQALADLAAIITDAQTKYNTSKTLVVGGSYAGNLAAWFRLKYPHIAYAALSSSAPIQAEVDFKEYLEVLQKSLETYDNTTSCPDNIRNATKSLESLLKTPSGRDEVKTLFNLCYDINITNVNDVEMFYVSLAYRVMVAVQYNIMDHAASIQHVCSVMNEMETTPLERYAKLNNRSLCLVVKFESLISWMRQTNWSSPPSKTGIRQWMFQTCTEFGYYQSTHSKAQPFGHEFPLKFYIDECKDIFGEDFNETFITSAVKRTNEMYGSLGIQLSRVIFDNGSLDPWHALGLKKATGLPEVYALYVYGMAHCGLMRTPTPDDAPHLIAAREKIKEIMKEWGF